MPDLADDLRDVGRHLDVVEDGGLADRVAAVMAAEPGTGSGILRRRRAVLAAFALAIASTGLVAAPAVADWWRMLVGGVEVRRAPAPAPPSTQVPPGDIGEALELGRLVGSLGEAGAASGLPVRSLSGAPPAQIRVGDVDGVVVVSLLYPPSVSRPATEAGVGVLLQQFGSPMGQPTVMTKFAGPDNRVEVVSVNGAPGVWIQGGHGIALRRGSEVVFAPARLAANTLAWEAGGVTYRLESALSQEASLELARGLR